jgi:endonuclease/exonuclease/phosphatase family metal-dependent hydrolase
MVSRIEVLVREIKRWFSRSEWIVRVLGLPVTKDADTSPGLIIIQIDGLSRGQLEKGFSNNRMPFLKKVLTEEHYQLHSLYTGAPSSTPSVQGELFYGVRCAVPAFSFYDKSTNNIQTMYEPSAAHFIEEGLQQQEEPLLKGGSAYCNIYGAGADEPHFCASSFGWGGLLRAANPFVFAFFLTSNIYSFIRTLALFILEFFIAIFDFFVGFIEGRDFVKELSFIPARVVICILLRELVTIGTKIDIARGLPIIHLNFLGYDEQAHRRGPSSKFAHWTLKGIDDSIKRIWRAANHASRRHYDIWIYSDHGQEDVIPYPKIYGISVEQAINEVFKSIYPLDVVSHGIQTQRIRFLGGTTLQKLFARYTDNHESLNNTEPVITAMGPLGLIYTPEPLPFIEKEILAGKLVNAANIPVVLYLNENRKVFAKTSEGTFCLPDDGIKLFGSDHPFLEEITQDIIAVCAHKYAGDFTILGWHKNKQYITFRIENGSHAGPGPNETHAFAMLPKDSYIGDQEHPYLRPQHIRDAAINILDRRFSNKNHAISKSSPKNKLSLRIMTYNIHSCIGMDGKVSPERIARVIARYHPDVVCLQEIDVKKMRSNTIDQAHYLAQLLKMKFHFHPAIHIEEERYGDAILTHLPMKLIKADILPNQIGSPTLEPRGALWVSIEKYGTRINIINTHLDVRKRARETQLQSLLGPEWLTNPNRKEPVILCGDFNTLPRSNHYKSITKFLRDTQVECKSNVVKATFLTRFPTARIDYIFIDEKINVENNLIPNTGLTRVASDHFPLIADITIQN